eukprot:CAMPEP_0183797624 /NCGR_PEP_ID=MMETSP0803_2-20130417/16440_1 /TAXON_ID=195967 /ORGANISM="Crustomastix stigmata, Strain CCMP3273" /LENGTH=103 /DNA_ID=CAMNT_0026042297 /DNA_START=234 /DNA_END=541 /DNA_ORIENTATION=+
MDGATQRSKPCVRLVRPQNQQSLVKLAKACSTHIACTTRGIPQGAATSGHRNAMHDTPTSGLRWGYGMFVLLKPATMKYTCVKTQLRPLVAIKPASSDEAGAS